ncbi:MAG: prepilin-type N-terminal cleavage/methylation domain-containing protein [Lentisphaeraceae bacterium]|nr:prepilin-type N-terminal cleavage/methylation domain-containing protein [Lentisphaeraceae bacterium]
MKNNKFTLIELLVVVAILGILSSILLPSLSQARAKGQSAVCKSNQRQIGVATILYTSEDNGKFPTFYRWNYEHQWATVMLGVMFLDMPGNLSNDAGGKITKDFQDEEGSVFTCSTQQDKFDSKRNISINQNLGWWWKDGAYLNQGGATSIDIMETPHKAVYAGDAGINNNGNGWWLQIKQAGGTNAHTGEKLFNSLYPHEQKANHVYLDNHVESISKTYGTRFYGQGNNENYTWMEFWRGQ